MLLAQALHQRLQLAVLQRRHVGEHVVLHLVVQPPVHAVDEVVARLEVGRGVSTAAEPLRAVRLARGVITVEVLARVIAGDDHEGVRVREELRQHRHAKGPQRSLRRRCRKRPRTHTVQGQRHDRGQSNHAGHRHDAAEPEDGEDEPEDHLLQRALEQSLYRVLEELEDSDRLRGLPALGPVLRHPGVLARQLQLLEGAGRVVGELPGEDPHDHGHVLQEHRDWQALQQLEVALH
mmetsp:Transcript_97156/g.251320  ORF Transcript_97156/g.251320 Transcript_97156/m.251320 type:complete len:235 (+) Transcript_97156:662-1366(+)